MQPCLSARPRTQNTVTVCGMHLSFGNCNWSDLYYHICIWLGLVEDTYVVIFSGSCDGRLVVTYSMFYLGRSKSVYIYTCNDIENGC
jgi:hypothetical protein